MNNTRVNTSSACQRWAKLKEGKEKSVTEQRFSNVIVKIAHRRKKVKGKKKNTHLRLCDAQSLKQLWMLDGQLNHFFDLLDLLVQAANHLIGGVWHLLHHHEGHQGVHLVGQDLVQGVAVISQSHAAVRGHLMQKGMSEYSLLCLFTIIF